MLLAYIDEANPEPNSDGHLESRFLVFGVVMIDAACALDFNDRVESMRIEKGFEKEDSLKFALHDKPEHVSKSDHADAKSQLLDIANDNGAKVIIYCALHKIIDVKGQDTYLNWGIDACLTKVQQFYRESTLENGFFCFLDRHSRPSMSAFLKEKFQDRNSQGREGHNTPDLIGLGQVWDGTSHLASLCDIVTGSFNYIINNPERDKAGKAMIRRLKPLVWGAPTGGEKVDVMERGLLFRPEEIKFDRYRQYYDETRARIVDWANDQADI